MLLKILGWVWIVSGILFFIKPLWFRNRLQKKSYKKIRGILFAIALTLSILLIKAVWGHPGLAAKVVLVLGIGGIIKAFFFLKVKAADTLIEWFIKQPLKVFRLFAAIQIVIGLMLLTI